MLSHIFLFIKANKYFSFFIFTLFIASLWLYGHHHPDEYGQTTNFLMLKMGIIEAQNLHWEYHHQMRPWAHIGFYYVLLLPVKALLGFNHLIFERVMHMSHFVIIIFIIFLWRNTFLNIKKNSSILNYLLTLWIIPYMALRHSSEVMAGLLCVIGILFWIKSKHDIHKTAFLILAALFLSFAFWIRVHLAFFFVGFFLYNLFIYLKERQYKPIIIFLLTFIFGILINLIIDYWGYRQWTLTPYNNFYQNIILKKSHNWGVSPWYTYFLNFPAFLINPFIIFWLFISMVRFKNNTIYFPIVLGVFLFLIGHSFTGHKEMRFLMPIIGLLFLFLPFLQETHKNFSFMFHQRFIKMITWLNIIVIIALVGTGNLVRDRMQPNHFLWSLEKQSQQYVIFTHTFYDIFYAKHIFVPYKGIFKKAVPKVYNEPPHLDIVYSNVENLQKACNLYPNSILILNSEDLWNDNISITDQNIPYTWQSAIYQLFPIWFIQKFTKRSWRFKALNCSQWEKTLHILNE